MKLPLFQPLGRALGWAHGMSSHNLGDPWRTWAVIIKYTNLNAKIKTCVENACFYHRVKHIQCVCCVGIKTTYIFIGVSILCGGLPLVATWIKLNNKVDEPNFR